jgi:hypothetical protein
MNCECGGELKFQGDIGQANEFKCVDCGKVYALSKGNRLEDD